MGSLSKLMVLDAASLVLSSRYFLSASAAVSLAVFLIFYGGVPSPSPSFFEQPAAVGAVTSCESPYTLMLKAAFLVPRTHCYAAFVLVVLAVYYIFFELHFIGELFNGFRGDPVKLTFHRDSDLFRTVVSKCRVLHGRFSPTIWLCSPHLQTSFQAIFGMPPSFTYKRVYFRTADGGTIGLDWLKNSDVADKSFTATTTSKYDIDKNTPIVIIIPGLASDSSHPYVKHIAFRIAKRGWNVCVSNHRGFAGTPLTSDLVGNGGWTEDYRTVVNHIHSEFPDTPLYGLGASIGANVLVKYLGENGERTPLVGAVAICCPWDLLICQKFLGRKLVQSMYNMAIAIGLKSHIQENKAYYSRVADWNAIKKARSIQDIDYAWLPILKFKTVDTYYRKISSVNYLEGVAVPLLCISSMDDPICTPEAIPWDEIRENKNIVLATTQHGGHIAHYEGATANSMWWVRAADEFLDVLHTSRFSKQKKKDAKLRDELATISSR